MTAFFVIFNRREQEAKQEQEQKFANATISPAHTTAPLWTGTLEDACVLKLEGASLTTVAEAQQAVEHFYPGLITNTPVVVTESQYKES